MPSELSLAAGDMERPSSSRYSHPKPSLLPPTQQPWVPPLHLTKVSLALSSARREEPTGEERRRPDTLHLWQERERRLQQQIGAWGPSKKDR